MMEDGFCICTQRSDKGKNKIILNLTKASAYLPWHCRSSWASVLFPYKRNGIGSSNAATGMCLLMLPAFYLPCMKRDGLPLEIVLKNMITVKFIRPPVHGSMRLKICMRKKEIVTKSERRHCSWKRRNDKWQSQHTEDSVYQEGLVAG